MKALSEILEGSTDLTTPVPLDCIDLETGYPKTFSGFNDECSEVISGYTEFVMNQVIRNECNNVAVIDLGCNYISNTELLHRCKMYVGIADSTAINCLETSQAIMHGNAKVFVTSIDHFITTLLPQLEIDTQSAVCLCKRLADLTSLAKKTFKNCYSEE